MSFTQLSTDIAIIGISALFPGAKDVRSFWQNILNKVDAVQDASDEWANPFFDRNAKENNRIYTRKGGFLGKLAEFNPMEFGIMPSSVDGGEPDQYLALKAARDALADAGYENRPFNREKTAIIIGRGTYPNRGNMSLVQHGLIVDQTLDLIRQLCPELNQETLQNISKSLKANLPPFNAETAPGLVPNVMTGRIANRLDLMGPNYIVDAACASSLIAIELSIRELLSGRCDMVLAGGVQASLLPVIAMIFCQLGALSKSNIRPFDESANGTLLGEGLGILVLKKLADAERDNDRIYAVIKGVGSSSDGKALGLMAPRLEGELLALERAYADTEIEPNSISLLEAHGTGISLGDRTEIRALSQVFGERQGLLPSCALGSVKSMIGHCLPAAGVAGIIKTALALYHKVLPPTLCDRVNPDLEIEKTPFYINNESRPWIHGNAQLPRRAAVNAFGFGGINAHAILEEYRGQPNQKNKLLHQKWPIELLVFSGSDRPSLLNLINKVRQIVKNQPDTPLANLAYTLSNLDYGTHRLAILARDLEELEAKLSFAIEKLAAPKKERLQTRNGIYYAEIAHSGKTAFLFPGEGSQYPNMLADLCLHFPKVREWFDLLDRAFYGERQYPPSSIVFPAPTSLTAEAQSLIEKQLYTQDVAVEVVFTACRALLELLNEFGIKCDVMVGHSGGETTALAVSGIVSIDGQAHLIKTMRQMNQIYRDLETSGSIVEGTLFTVGAINFTTLNELIANAKKPVYLAMDNCPNQVVLFSENTDFEAAISDFKAAGGICTRLPFGRASHTPLNEAVTNALASFYNSIDMGPGHTPLYSCANCEPFPAEPEAIRRLAAIQWIGPVRFRETIEKLYNEGVRNFIEVGPRSNLTGFVEDILRGRNHLALASNSQRKSGLEQIEHLLARLFVNQVKVNLAPLYSHRELTEISLDDAIDIKNGSRKANPVLELNIPVMRLEAGVVKTIQDSMRSDSKTLPEPIIPIYAIETQARIPDQAPINIPAISEEPQLSVISAHFELMQEFLANQARVTTEFYSKFGTYQDSEENPSLFSWSENTFNHEEMWPFLGTIIEKDSDYLYSERSFDINKDLFLYDHTLGGQLSQQHPELLPLPIIPFTISMEILAEAAAYLVGENKCVISLYNLRGYRWLALDRGQLVLGILAQMQPKIDEQTRDVYVQIFQQSGTTEVNNRSLVFEGYVKLADSFPLSTIPMAFDLEQPKATRFNDETLYTTGMFHGPRLRGVKRIRRWTEQGIEADLETLSTEDFFSFTQQPILQTDAGLLDAIGQLVGYWVSEQFGFDFNVFPYHVGAVHLYAPPLAPNTPILGRGLMRFTSEELTEANLDMLAPSGQVIARVEGWQDRYFPVPSHYYQCRLYPQTAYLSSAWMQQETDLICRRIDPLQEGFLDDAWAIWKRTLAHLMLNQKERDFWYSLPEKGPRRTDWLLGRIAAKDAIRQWAKNNFNMQLAPVDIEVMSTNLGKPIAVCQELQALSAIPDISISHSRGYVVAALAKPGQSIGIDIERLDRIHSEDLLSAAFSPQELEMLQKMQLPQPEKSKWIVGFWSAKEATAKALGTGLKGNPKQFQVSYYSLGNGQIIINHAGVFFYVNLWYTEKEVLAICQHPS